MEKRVYLIIKFIVNREGTTYAHIPRTMVLMSTWSQTAKWLKKYLDLKRSQKDFRIY